MAYALSPYSLHARAEVVCSVVLLWSILLRVSWRGANSKDVRPLLECFVIVLG